MPQRLWAILSLLVVGCTFLLSCDPYQTYHYWVYNHTDKNIEVVYMQMHRDTVRTVPVPPNTDMQIYTYTGLDSHKKPFGNPPSQAFKMFVITQNGDTTTESFHDNGKWTYSEGTTTYNTSVIEQDF